jgi:hypothetical protein
MILSVVIRIVNIGIQTDIFLSHLKDVNLELSVISKRIISVFILIQMMFIGMQ